MEAKKVPLRQPFLVCHVSPGQPYSLRKPLGFGVEGAAMVTMCGLGSMAGAESI